MTYYAVSTAAELARTSTAFLRRCIDRGELASIKHQGQELIKKADFWSWTARRNALGSTAAGRGRHIHTPG
jgi:hypothetical protein